MPKRPKRIAVVIGAIVALLIFLRLEWYLVTGPTTSVQFNQFLKFVGILIPIIAGAFIAAGLASYAGNKFFDWLEK